jgi:hypothetical protein
MSKCGNLKPDGRNKRHRRHKVKAESGNKFSHRYTQMGTDLKIPDWHGDRGEGRAVSPLTAAGWNEHSLIHHAGGYG